jgi:hypothetical protein
MEIDLPQAASWMISNANETCADSGVGSSDGHLIAANFLPSSVISWSDVGFL